MILKCDLIYKVPVFVLKLRFEESIKNLVVKPVVECSVQSHKIILQYLCRRNFNALYVDLFRHTSTYILGLGPHDGTKCVHFSSLCDVRCRNR
jgi:hypothetical protein